MARTLAASDLAGFIGSETFYRHSLNRKILYTDGVKFFAERAGAYWFLDVLAFELERLRREEEFMSIKLDVAFSKPTAKIVVDDGNGNILHTKDVEFTDAPSGEWKFYMTAAEDGQSVVMLPSGY